MKRSCLIVCFCVTCWVNTAAADGDSETVGLVLAVQGTVTIQSAAMTPPVPVRPFDEVGPLSILDSQPGARCKVLYTDDSLITLAEKSRLEITEQSYRAGSDQRAFVAHLVRGAVRALVGRQFEGDNSTFEIHAGTSVATARGTYFVVWVNGPPAPARDSRKLGSRFPTDLAVVDAEGATGVANIGRDGMVSFTSGGATVLILPGQFSMAVPGEPPRSPTSIQPHILPVSSAIEGTHLPDQLKPESPKEALAAAGIIGGAGGGVTATAVTGPALERTGPLGGQAPSGSYVLPDWPFPVTPVTPPAVASGAAPAASGTNVNLIIRLP